MLEQNKKKKKNQTNFPNLMDLKLNVTKCL